MWPDPVPIPRVGPDDPRFGEQFDLLWQAVAPALLSDLKGMLGRRRDEADDLLHDLYLHVRHRAWRTFRPEQARSLRPWLRQIARNFFCTSVRQRRSRPGDFGDGVPLAGLPEAIGPAAAPDWHLSEERQIQVNRVLEGVWERVSPRDFMVYYLTELRPLIEPGTQALTAGEALAQVNALPGLGDEPPLRNAMHVYRVRDKVKAAFDRSLEAAGADFASANWQTFARAVQHRLADWASRERRERRLS